MRNITEKPKLAYYNETINKISSPLNLIPDEHDEGKRAPTVVVVDKDALSRNIVRLALIREGYTVLDANGPAELKRICDSLNGLGVDLLIMDYGGGFTMSRNDTDAVRKVSPELKLLVISTSTYQAVCDGDGIPAESTFLQKPFTPQQITTIVRRILFPGTQ